MIDWFNLAANSCWIFGCAVALAVVSYASWQSALAHEHLRTHLAKPAIQSLLYLAGVLFCLGLAGTAGQWWETTLWLALTLWFGFQMAVAWRQARELLR